ncbi:hypothetical protein D7Z94_14115 [Ulvibacterium marinum]|uniref:Uncharacterized protein n=1 Tax=Ulvibacterium marinum TaxID=2419782 RepID=A0A3B0C8K2_9FLAO|nr:hypothetical protein D7Z94_14115 [Ulvibacterium marinum]
MMWKYFIAWAPMIFIAIANGIFREKFLAGRLRELAAHQVSTVTLVILFGIYIWIVIRNWKPESTEQAITIGLLWLGLTVLFEFLFGHYVAGHSWSKLFQDYNILKGRVWIIVLVWVTIAPYIFYRLQK